MLGLPAEYAVHKPFQINTFMTTDLTPKEKKRFKEAVTSIKLEYQIIGEAVPSLINEQYDCQAILYFNIGLNTLKDASFVSQIIQKLVKSLCVVKFSDPKEQFVYSLAHKRLNQQDKTQNVIEDAILTIQMSSLHMDVAESLMAEYVDYHKLRNKSNKLSMYLEMLVKTYIISHLYAWSGSRQLLHSNAWYNIKDMLVILEKYKYLVELCKDKKKAITISEQAKINSELKITYNYLNFYMDK